MQKKTHRQCFPLYSHSCAFLRDGFSGRGLPPYSGKCRVPHSLFSFSSVYQHPLSEMTPGRSPTTAIYGSTLTEYFSRINNVFILEICLYICEIKISPVIFQCIQIFFSKFETVYKLSRHFLSSRYV